MTRQMRKWDKFTDDIIEKEHGKIEFYRDLYDGKHHEIFPRAKDLITKGEVVQVLESGMHTAVKQQPPYIVANVAKLVIDIPSMLVSRAIGAPTLDKEQTFNIPKGDGTTEQKKLSDILQGIAERSKFPFEHWTNISQHQTDGGIVGVVINDENGIRIDTKARDMYYPHADGLGCDLVYKKEIYVGEEGGKDKYEEFVQIHREYVEEGDLYTEELLFEMNESGQLAQIEDESEVADLLGMETQDLKVKYEGRTRPFVEYWANDRTFRHPLGQSAIKNQESKQDEINWSLTRSAIVYQRNGKPRIAVSKSIFTELQNKAFDRHGDESKIDSDDLEITTYDEQGKSLEVIQVDVTKIGDISWVKDLMKLMFVETRTSEKAVDFYLDNSGGGGAQSGIAKYYDLFVSIMKSEKIATEYIHFLQSLYESALWMLQKDEGFETMEIQKPNITLKEMIPTTRNEKIEAETKAFNGGDGIQSLFQSIKELRPHWTDEQIEAEVARIEEERQSTDTNTLALKQNDVATLLGNRDKKLVDPNDPNAQAGDEGDNTEPNKE